MNVYDFDKTIYAGDSTLDFYKHCLKKYPILYIYLLVQISAMVMYKLGIIKKLKFKEIFYGFLKYVKNPENEVILFWKNNKSNIKTWYIQQSKENDVIISASPYFLLKPICEELGILHLISSKVDIKSGKCLGENCYGMEKVERYKQEFYDLRIKEFYSDSYSDSPMAELAESSFIVRGEVISPWSKKN